MKLYAHKFIQTAHYQRRLLELNLTRQEVAKALSIRVGYLSGLVHGKAPINKPRLREALVRVLKTDHESLFFLKMNVPKGTKEED